MRKLFSLVAVGLLSLAGYAVVAGEADSGLKIGDAPDAFNVLDCSGPSEGISLCYRCKYGARPTVAIFTREINDEVVSLVQQIDEQVGENADKKMAAFVVLLTDDPDANQPKLKKLAADKGIKNVPLTVFDGVAGPPEYKLAEGAAVTVLMWNKSNVKVNKGFEEATLSDDDVAAVSKETSKILN
ncbi:MAG: hypothetical protein WD065_13225 [Planctomycetaceae bacterium]